MRGLTPSPVALVAGMVQDMEYLPCQCDRRREQAAHDILLEPSGLHRKRFVGKIQADESFSNRRILYSSRQRPLNVTFWKMNSGHEEKLPTSRASCRCVVAREEYSFRESAVHDTRNGEGTHLSCARRGGCKRHEPDIISSKSPVLN